MANEIVAKYTTGSTVYATLFNSVGKIWNASTFVTPFTSGWTSYAIGMTEYDTTGVYSGNFPSVAAGTYGVSIFAALSAAKLPTDICLGSGEINWDGSAEVVLNSIPGNVWTSSTRTLTSSSMTSVDVQTGMTAQGYTSARATKLDNLDATISSVSSTGAIAAAVWGFVTRALTDKTNFTLLASEHTAITQDSTGALNSFGYTPARSLKLDNLDTLVSTAGSTGAIALAIWSYVTRALTDKNNFVLSSGEHTNIASDTQTGLTAQGYTTTRAPKLDNLDLPITSRQASGLVNINLAQTVGHSQVADTIGRALQISRAAGRGRWVIDPGANTLTVYDTDNSTIVSIFSLSPIGGPYTGRTPVAE